MLGVSEKERPNWRDLIFGRAKIKKRPVLNWVHSNTGRDQDLFAGYYINNELWPQYLVQVFANCYHILKQIITAKEIVYALIMYKDLHIYRIFSA